MIWMHKNIFISVCIKTYPCNDRKNVFVSSMKTKLLLVRLFLIWQKWSDVIVLIFLYITSRYLAEISQINWWIICGPFILKVILWTGVPLWMLRRCKTHLIWTGIPPRKLKLYLPTNRLFVSHYMFSFVLIYLGIPVCPLWFRGIYMHIYIATLRQLKWGLWEFRVEWWLCFYNW